MTTTKCFSSEVEAQYKKLSIEKLLEDFERNLPTLKDVSSLFAMSVNYVSRIEGLVPAPKSKEDFENWLKHLGLHREFERAQRVSAGKKNPKGSMDTFVRTNCPELIDVYQYHFT